MKLIILAWNYLRIGVANELQYRVNFFIQIFQSVIALGIGLIGLALVFAHTSSLGGWSQPELLVVMGVYILMGGLIQAFIQPNMQRLMTEIGAGTLDFALTKPVDGQALIVVREVRFWSLADVAVGLIVLVVAVIQIHAVMSLWQMLAFVLTLILGAIMIYSFWMILTSIAFWVIRVDEIFNLFEGVYAAGRWPVSIYPDWLRLGLTFLVPVAFAVTIPAQALTNRLDVPTLLAAVALTVFFVALARLVWKLGVRNYSGASA